MKRLLTGLLPLAAAFLAGAAAFAQEPPQPPPPPPPPPEAHGRPPAPPPPPPEEPPELGKWMGNRFLQTQTPLTNDAGIFEALFAHRFYNSVVDGGGNTLFGLDSSANVLLYMEYVPVKDLAIQVARGTFLGDYEFAVKGSVLRPRPGMPVGIGVRAGLNWLTENYANRQSSGFVQGLFSATVADRVTFSAAPSVTQRTPSRQGGVFNVPLAVQLRITRSTFVVGEYIPKNYGPDDRKGQWSFGVEKEVYHHRFTLWIGNSGAQTVDQMLAGDYNGGVKDSNIRLGFNLLRQFDLAGGAP